MLNAVCTFTHAMKLKQVVCVIIIGFLCRLNYADDIYTQICTYFLSCDSILEEMGNELAQIQELNASDKLLMDKIRAHAEFELFLRTNSKGIIISKVTRDRIEPRKYRNIGDQNWHKILKISNKSYYGSVVNKKGYYLFWCKPLMTRSKAGYNFGGTLAAKIDLNRVFNTISETHEENFQVMYLHEILYSSPGKKASGEVIEKRLPVYGMPELILRCNYGIKGEEPAFSIGDKEQKRVVASVQDTSKKKLDMPALTAENGEKKEVTKVELKTKPAMGKEEGDTKTGEKQTPRIKMAVFLVLIAICLVLVGVTLFILKKAVDRNRKMMEAIDKGE